MNVEIDSLAIVRALRAASGYPGFLDNGQAFALRIAEDPTALNAVAEEIRYESWVALIKAAVPDHSQFGEFKLLLQALLKDAASPGVVVDVGANSRTGSNSYDLISGFGWRGVLIEALPARASKLHEEFGEGDYSVVECAVGLTTGRQPLWLGQAAFITSLDKTVADMFNGQGESIEVEVRRLDDILDKSGVPHDFDVLSIDIEGIDVSVFNDFIENSPYRPRYVIIEAPFGIISMEDTGFTPAVTNVYYEISRTIANRVLRRI